MKTYSNAYTQQVFQVISPLVGDLMARGIIKTQTKNLNINEEQIELKHLPQLAEGMKLGLTVFLGSQTAQLISGKIAQIR